LIQSRKKKTLFVGRHTRTTKFFEEGFLIFSYKSSPGYEPAWNRIRIRLQSILMESVVRNLFLTLNICKFEWYHLADPHSLNCLYLIFELAPLKFFCTSLTSLFADLSFRGQIPECPHAISMFFSKKRK